MATAHRRLPTDAPTDQLPADLPEVPDSWRETTDRDDLNYSERVAWVHEETGHRVSVRSDAKPDQMHTPETSRMDRGFVGYVRGEEYGGQLSYELAAKVSAYEAAVRFMAKFPDGQYEVPDPADQRLHGAPLRWDDE